ncbi:MAG: acyltransferase [Candidatus Heimdallarchaeota archaeon]|nr:acyltransferase [Candidatus Heimdallarchaeota archaeon]MCK5143696.1 acyltransferase [Candidatus Heimdallarchaeota archaeon]
MKNWKEEFLKWIDFEPNEFHQFVWIRGKPKIGENVYIGFFSVINAKDSSIEIGDNCDISTFVSISCADSHKRCIGLSEEIERKPIVLENNVFVGSHSVIKGGAHIGHHSVVAAATVVDPVKIPPYSLIIGNPMKVKEGYYKDKL